MEPMAIISQNHHAEDIFEKVYAIMNEANPTNENYMSH
jgi:hypothetical protein